jgi:hypothetical protein
MGHNPFVCKATSTLLDTNLPRVGFRPFLFSRSGVSQHRHPPPISNMLDHNGQIQNAIVLRTIGWSLKPLKDFVKTCHNFKIDNRSGTTTVYFSSGNERDPYTGGEWSSVVKVSNFSFWMDGDGLQRRILHSSFTRLIARIILYGSSAVLKSRWFSHSYSDLTLWLTDRFRLSGSWTPLTWMMT